MNQDPRAFQENARAALIDPLLKPALGRLKTHFGAGRAMAVQRYGDFEALREMGVKAEPRALLASVGDLSLAEITDPQTCCGFGGLFSVKYPEISERMADDKIADACATGADTLVGGDLGCLLHLKGRMARQGKTLSVRHAAEVLADMGGEPALGETGK